MDDNLKELLFFSYLYCTAHNLFFFFCLVLFPVCSVRFAHSVSDGWILALHIMLSHAFFIASGSRLAGWLAGQGRLLSTGPGTGFSFSFFCQFYLLCTYT